MRRIAVLIHQYGEKVVGGAESYARELAEHLKDQCDVTVLTTASSDYSTWADDYKPGKEIVNGVNVIRFSVAEIRNPAFGDWCDELTPRLESGGESTYEEDSKWIDWEGPNCPEMIAYIKEHCDDYDVFMFITYIYYVAVRGIPEVFDKTIFIPTAHDETWIKLSTMRDLFRMPRYFGFLTEEERDLVHGRFHNEYIPYDVLGIGIDVPMDIDAERFRKKYKIRDPYLIYVGRLDSAKGCDELIRYFLNYKKEHSFHIKLVLVGTGKMPIPASEDIIKTGFVTDTEKFDAIAGAFAMVTPSRYESLCISLLEALALKIPVIANAKCQVLKGQCNRSNAGLYYDDEYDFFIVLDFLLQHPEVCVDMGENGFAYIETKYKWKQVVQKVMRMVDEVIHYNQSLVKVGSEQIISEDNKLFIPDKNDIIPIIAEDAIPVVIAADNNYADFAAITIESIIRNSSSERMYDCVILTNNTVEEKVCRILQLADGHKNISIRFAYVNEMMNQLHMRVSKDYKLVTYYRFLIPQIMPDYSKLLYLDADVIVNADVAELWDKDIGSHLLGATFDTLATAWQMYDSGFQSYFDALGLDEPGKYYQAGVLLINNEEMKKSFPADYFLKIAQEQDYILNDQDIINVFCKNRIYEFGHEWNTRNFDKHVWGLCKEKLPRRMYRRELEAVYNPKIIHYCESSFPCWKQGHFFEDLYWKYAWGTSFYDILVKKRIEKIKELANPLLKEGTDTSAFVYTDRRGANGIDLLPLMLHNEAVEIKGKRIVMHPGGCIYGPYFELGKGVHRLLLSYTGAAKAKLKYKIVAGVGHITIFQGEGLEGVDTDVIIQCKKNYIKAEVIINNDTNQDITITELFL